MMNAEQIEERKEYQKQQGIFRDNLATQEAQFPSHEFSDSNNFHPQRLSARFESQSNTCVEDADT